MEIVRSWQPYPGNILSLQTDELPPSRWAYSPDFQNCNPPVCIGMATLNMTGSRSRDRAALWQNVSQTPDRGYHCHHTYSYSGGNNPTADMELVKAADHIRTYPHRGAVYQWNTDGSKPHYCAERQSVTSVSVPQTYTAKEIASFEWEQGVTLPSFLQEVYKGEQSLPSLWRDDQGNSYELQDILYLTDLPEKSNALSAAAVMKLWPTLQVEKTPGKGPFFWGEDACGNLFLNCQNDDTVYFYDHEEDTYAPVHKV